ncbi:N-acetylmuramoyl-L-alanine amidase [Streptococcus danieliae]|nr:N-acetylmuramoyl-L-alanine amidase [Streptococcus danieliae]
MVTAMDVVNYANGLVGKKVTVPTNPYGGQCVALIDHIVQHFTDGKKNLAYVNAVDGLKKAKEMGLIVIYNNPNDPYLLPEPGDFFVMNDPHSWGHIGVVVSADVNGMHTIEQNIDGYRDDNGNGINDQLEVGGGGYTRKNYRDYSNVIGWFRLPYSDQKQKEGKVTVEPKTVGEDLFSGLTTKVDPNIMNADSNRATVNLIVIHHNAGTSDENARRTWYKSTGIGTSAHYQVTPTDIWGCVGENYVAYHAGDYGVNQRSIGIEHLNSTGARSWQIAEETYKNSAKLIADLCRRYKLPIDRKHIVGHREIVATACPGGIDIDKLIRMAQEVANGAVKETKVEKKEVVDMFTISAKDRGIALMTGGVFYSLLDAKDPENFWNQGVPHIQVSPKTFDNFQTKSNVDKLDDETVNKLIAGLKK